MNIFVGNLSFDAVEADVKKLFEGFGTVASAVIVMEKEKKAPKSRGFGFVEMPDNQQALDAIAALNNREFMGRAINVSPARPKTEVERKNELKQTRHPGIKAKVEPYHGEGQEQKKTWYSAVFNKPGTYRGGRRTRSYVNKQALAGVQVPEEPKPRRGNKDNPMRWRKKKDQPRPWKKTEVGEHKPWKKAEGGEHKPWKKTEVGEHKPWKKTEAGEHKPWKKAEGGEHKPWKKTEAGEHKPWKKSTGEPKQREKPIGTAKPWQKSSERPQRPSFNSRRNLSRYKK